MLVNSKNQNILSNLKKTKTIFIFIIDNEIFNDIECWRKKAEAAQNRVQNNFNVAVFYNKFYDALLRT